MSERTEYLVLLPTRPEGIDYGYLAPLRVLGTTYEDALRRATEEWWGTGGYEGVAIVVPAEGAIGYVLGEIRGFDIRAETSLPDVRKDLDA